LATRAEVEALDYVRLVEQDAAQVRVLGEQRREQPAAAAAEVDDRLEAAEVVSREERVDNEPRTRHHRCVEDRALLRMLRAVVPDAHAVCEPEGVLSRPDALDEMSPRVAVVRPADQDGPPGD